MIPARLHNGCHSVLRSWASVVHGSRVEGFSQILPPLTPCQRAALIDFTYNLGEEALAGSTLARLFNAGQAQAGCGQLSRWGKARVQGELVTLRGLVDRRGAELEVCLGQLQEVANAR